MTIQQLVDEINAAGYQLDIYQYENKRWEVSLHGKGRANEICFGDTLTETLTAAAEKAKGVAAQDASLLE